MQIIQQENFAVFNFLARALACNSGRVTSGKPWDVLENVAAGEERSFRARQEYSLATSRFWVKKVSTISNSIIGGVSSRTHYDALHLNGRFLNRDVTGIVSFTPYVNGEQYLQRDGKNGSLDGYIAALAYGLEQEVNGHGYWEEGRTQLSRREMDLYQQQFAVLGHLLYYTAKVIIGNFQEKNGDGRIIAEKSGVKKSSPLRKVAVKRQITLKTNVRILDRTEPNQLLIHDCRENRRRNGRKDNRKMQDRIYLFRGATTQTDLYVPDRSIRLDELLELLKLVKLLSSGDNKRFIRKRA